jgi:hypothetical protein
MSLDNAKENLKGFGKELGLEGLEFDEHNTCILGIDDQFSLHITYEPRTEYLYVYAPILDGLPRDDKLKLKLYTVLLEGSMLGGQMAGGGVGVAEKEELILMHIKLPMQHAHANELAQAVAPFVERVEYWRKRTKDLSEGRDDEAPSDKPVQPFSGGKPGQGFIKI